MANNVETSWILNLVDRISAPLRNISNITNKANSSINSYTNNISSASTSVNSAINSQTQEFRELGNEIENTQAKSLGLKDFLSYILPTISIAAVGAGIGATISKSLRLGMEQDMQKASFDTFLGEDSASKMLKNITAYISPYGSAVNEAAKQMLNFQIAQEDIMPNLKAIGDIAMGDIGKFNSLSLAFSQMSATGKLTGQDLMQMVNAGFSPLSEISRKTGKSLTLLKDEMAKGAISSDMVRDAFISATSAGGAFYQMNDKMMQTLGGKYAQFQTNFNAKLLIFYKKIQPIAINVLTAMNSALNYSVEIVKGVINIIQSGHPVITVLKYSLAIITGLLIAQTTATLIQATASKGLIIVNTLLSASFWKAALAILKTNTALLLNPAGLVVIGVIALIAAITYLIFKVDGWGEAWKHTVKATSAIWKGFTASMKLGWLETENFLMKGIDVVAKGWYKIKSLWDEEGSKEAIDKINQASEQRQQKLLEQHGKVSDLAKEAKEETNMAVKSLKWNDKSIKDVFKDVKSKLGITSPKVDSNGSLMPVVERPKDGKKLKEKDSMSISGKGNSGAKTITQNLTINNYFQKGNNTEERSLADKIITQINDGLRDNLTTI